MNEDMSTPTIEGAGPPPTGATCAVCGAGFGGPELRAMHGAHAACTACGAEMRAAVFPAAARAVSQGEAGEPLVDPSESPCFFHEDRRANTACVRCGRFVCALCELPMPPGPYCPECLDSVAETGEADWLKTEWTLDGTLALAIAAAPLMLIWLTGLLVLPISVDVGLAAMAGFLGFPALVTGPIAIFLGFRARRADTGPIGPGRWHAGLAILLGALQLVLLVVGMVGLMGAWI